MLNIMKINRRFRWIGEKILAFRWFNIAAFLLLVVIGAIGLKQVQSDTDMESWFLEDDQILEVKDRFENIFGNDQFCAVLIEAKDVFTPEVLTGIRSLGLELKQKVPHSDDVVSLTDLEYIHGTDEGINIGPLVPEPVPNDPVEMEEIRGKSLAKPSLKNRIVSEDSRYTWLMLRLKPLPDGWQEKGEENPEQAIARAFYKVINQEKYSFLNLKATGLPVIAHDKMNFFSKETPKVVGFSLLVTLLVLSIFLRNVRGVIFPFVTIVGGLVIVFGAQGFLGILIDPSMIFVPILLGIALSTSYSIHIFNFFRREFFSTGKRRESVLCSIEENGWPLLFCALTTMVALFSFCLVPMRPIRWVGLTAAAQVGVMYLMVLVMLPTLLSFGKDCQPRSESTKKKKGLDSLMEGLGNRVLKRPRTVLVVFPLIAAICLVGTAFLDVSFDVRRTFGLKVPYVKRITSVADTSVGSLYSYGVAIEFPEAGQAKDPENLKKFEQLTKEVSVFPLTKKITSLLDIIKDMNQSLNSGDPAFYKIPESQELVAQQLLLYENAGGSEAERWVDYDYQRLRLMVDMNDYNSGEAAAELARINELAGQLFPDAHVLLIGSISQFTVMQDYVTWGQIRSFLLALVVITILMSVVFGSIRIGLIGMIPNVAPALLVGGIMGIFNIPLDMMTVTIMPMLLGLAVDDTIHFINYSQLEFTRTRSYAESTCRTFIVVGSALLLTSLTLILCFSAYLISTAKVFVCMGILIGSGILAALLADFFVTPVLLDRVRPFGQESVRVDNKSKC